MIAILNRTQEVDGSSPFSSTTLAPFTFPRGNQIGNQVFQAVRFRTRPLFCAIISIRRATGPGTLRSPAFHLRTVREGSFPFSPRARPNSRSIRPIVEHTERNSGAVIDVTRRASCTASRRRA